MGVNDITEARIAEIMDLVQATPRRLAASTAGLDDNRLSQSPIAGEWSPLEILNHLRACEEVWMHSLHAMLAHENPRLQEIHPRQWIQASNPYTRQTFSAGLRVFTLRREALLLTLSSLSLEDWARGAIIDQKTHTVYSHVRRMALHEQTHCDEIDALLRQS
jgi:hypothetical protein